MPADVYGEISDICKQRFERAFVENVRSCWFHSAHTVLGGRKGFVVTSTLREETEATVVRKKRAG